MSETAYKKSRDPKSLITREQLKQQLTYDPETGSFVWNLDFRHRRKGDRAGDLNTNGYLQTWVLGKRYLLHRLAYLYMEGTHPDQEIDHIDGDRTNNRWDNLRHVPGAVNAKNLKRSRRNKTGCTGISLCPVSAKWVATISVNGQLVTIGRYKMKFEARQARKAAEKKYGYHDNHGR